MFCEIYLYDSKMFLINNGIDRQFDDTTELICKYQQLIARV
jgi:hypothetical protein